MSAALDLTFRAMALPALAGNYFCWQAERFPEAAAITPDVPTATSHLLTEDGLVLLTEASEPLTLEA